MVLKKLDICVSWDNLEKEDYITVLQKKSRKNNLSFRWINADNIRETIRAIESRNLTINMLVDNQATYNLEKDPYVRLCYAAKDRGSAVINDPDRARLFTDKSVSHYELQKAGLTTPFTVIVRNWRPSVFRLTEEEKSRLGRPFIIKPGQGYGQLGVVKDASGTIKEIALARNYDRDDNFLIQEKIEPAVLDGRRAWFRVYNIFNTIIPCLWDDCTNIYEFVDSKFFNRFALKQLVLITSKIAEISGMHWFSTEIALEKKNRKKRFVIVDYVNDQCDLSLKSKHSNGVPDEIVDYVTDSFVKAAASLKKKDKIYFRSYKVLLKDGELRLEGLSAPRPLVMA